MLSASLFGLVPFFLAMALPKADAAIILSQYSTFKSL
jgi:hypothetical protein